MEIIPFLPGIRAHDEAFARIYEGSFPAAERSETPELFEELVSGVTLALAAVDGEALAGLAVWKDLESAPASFLEYLAVDPGLRNGGIGGRLFDILCERLRAESGSQWLVWEVEPPYAAAEPERSIRHRRIAFYERHDSHVLVNAPLYRVPRSDGEGLLPFILMARALHQAAQLPAPADLRAIVRAILIEGYEIDEQDQLLRSVIEDIVA